MIVGLEALAQRSQAGSVAANFWSNVDKDAMRDSTGCWLFKRSLLPSGYGRIMVGSKVIYAHRFAYTIVFGDPGRAVVRHTCDVPSCVNPAHLLLGTTAENKRDSCERLRASFKIDPQAAQFIREQIRLGATGVEMARRFGVSEETIRKIKRGKRLIDRIHSEDLA